MHGKARKRDKPERNAADADNASELKHFAQRNKVSLDEARALIGQFGDDRQTDPGKAIPKSRPSEKACVSPTELAKKHSHGDAAMSEREEDFMDKWLDRNIRSSQLKHPELLVAKVLAKQCVADAEKEGVTREALEEVVVDVEQAISDELKVAKAKETR
jgi:hypothetical protein